MEDVQVDGSELAREKRSVELWDQLPFYRSAGDPLAAVAAELGLPEGRVIEITGARRGSAAFLTDRGPRPFPAWFLQIEDALGPVVVLDPDLECHAVAGVDGVFVARGTTIVSASEVAVGHVEPTDTKPYARLAADGRTLTIRFVGSPEAREVTATLAEPLGDRVIVDWRTGHPLSM